MRSLAFGFPTNNPRYTLCPRSPWSPFLRYGRARLQGLDVIKAVSVIFEILLLLCLLWAVSLLICSLFLLQGLFAASQVCLSVFCASMNLDMESLGFRSRSCWNVPSEFVKNPSQIRNPRQSTRHLPRPSNAVRRRDEAEPLRRIVDFNPISSALSTQSSRRSGSSLTSSGIRLANSVLTWCLNGLA